MPYNIWCDGCNNHIGMGVRYNAEKSKVGMYYTTPIYKFRMKCHLCDNHFEIKTDPAVSHFHIHNPILLNYFSVDIALAYNVLSHDLNSSMDVLLYRIMTMSLSLGLGGKNNAGIRKKMSRLFQKVSTAY